MLHSKFSVMSMRRREGHSTVTPVSLAAFSMSAAATQNDQVLQGDLLARILLDRPELRQHGFEMSRPLTSQSFW